MTTASSPPPRSQRATGVAIAAAVVAAIGAGAWWTSDRWLPLVRRGAPPADAAEHDADHDHEQEHGHDHEPDHDHDQEHEHSAAAANHIEVSETALKNIGYLPATVALSSYERTQTMPAMVVERAGKTQVHVTAPFTGVLDQIAVSEGEAIEPNSKMFELRMTHEELVAAQQDYLKTAESLDVVNREIARLKSLAEGVIPGKLILDQQYEAQKLAAALRADEQGLLLHGLTEDQVAEILRTRKLLRSFVIRAPDKVHAGDAAPSDHAFTIQRLPVSPGQQVKAGQELCVLADHCQLYVEGRAFEDDAKQLRAAARDGWAVTAKLQSDKSDAAEAPDLKLQYLADSVDPESRAFRFYLPLPNSVVLDQKDAEGRRFIEWRFKPGQRMELRVPIERLDKRIVLPAEAVVEEGAEQFVYRQNGHEFERVPVHLEFRDADAAVIAQDGALSPGDTVAGHGAYQLHLQLKNKSGGAIDPHAGHNH